MDRDTEGFRAAEACSLKLASGPAAAHMAREWLGWLGHHLSPTRLDVVRLIVSELVSNSVLHSGLAEGAAIRVSGRAGRERIRISVCDCGEGLALAWPPRRPETAAVGGRGLWIVHQLADRVLVDGARGRVSFELAREPTDR